MKRISTLVSEETSQVVESELDDTAYEKVKIVSDNIADVTSVADNMGQLLSIDTAAAVAAVNATAASASSASASELNASNSATSAAASASAPAGSGDPPS